MVGDKWLSHMHSLPIYNKKKLSIYQLTVGVSATSNNFCEQ